MTVSGALREIADAIEDLQAAGVDVVDLSTRECDPAEGDRLAVDLAVTTDVLRDAVAEGVEITPEGATIDDDGTVTADLSLAVPVRENVGRGGEGETTESGEPEAEAADGEGGTGGEDVEDEEDAGTPVHRDPEELRAAYGEHDTFAEMTEALGADVTPQTVRRQMIEHGIHEPGDGGATGNGTADEGGGEEAETSGAEAERAKPGGGAEPGGEDGEGTQADDPEGREPADEPGDGAAGRARPDDGGRTTIADGIDLPAGATLTDLKRAVASARTLHEVQRELGIDRGRARRLLSELDLLDLVAGRLAEEREVPMEEIERRIEGAAPGRANCR